MSTIIIIIIIIIIISSSSSIKSPLMHEMRGRESYFNKQYPRSTVTLQETNINRRKGQFVQGGEYDTLIDTI